MATLRGDCPYCKTRNVSLEVTGNYDRPQVSGAYERYSLLACGFCGRAALGIFSGPDRGRILDARFLVDIHPQPDMPPKHLPDQVSQRYSEAVSIVGTAPEAAGMMFRKTLEIALKTIRPDDTGSLKTRIDLAAKAGAITTDLAEWAHRIRLDGNDAAHEEDPFSPDEVNALHRFTELVLMYLFSLPGMLEEWRSTKS